MLGRSESQDRARISQKNLGGLSDAGLCVVPGCSVALCHILFHLPCSICTSFRGRARNLIHSTTHSLYPQPSHRSTPYTSDFAGSWCKRTWRSWIKRLRDSIVIRSDPPILEMNNNSSTDYTTPSYSVNPLLQTSCYLQLTRTHPECHQLRCNHIIRTSHIEPCGSNCKPLPSTNTNITLPGAPFSCKQCASATPALRPDPRARHCWADWVYGLEGNERRDEERIRKYVARGQVLRTRVNEAVPQRVAVEEPTSSLRYSPPSVVLPKLPQQYWEMQNAQQENPPMMVLPIRGGDNGGPPELASSPITLHDQGQAAPKNAVENVISDATARIKAVDETTKARVIGALGLNDLSQSLQYQAATHHPTNQAFMAAQNSHIQQLSDEYNAIKTMYAQKAQHTTIIPHTDLAFSEPAETEDAHAAQGAQDDQDDLDDLEFEAALVKALLEDAESSSDPTMPSSGGADIDPNTEPQPGATEAAAFATGFTNVRRKVPWTLVDKAHGVSSELPWVQRNGMRKYALEQGLPEDYYEDEENLMME